jgi:hypothetical protein
MSVHPRGARSGIGKPPHSRKGPPSRLRKNDSASPTTSSTSSVPNGRNGTTQFCHGKGVPASMATKRSLRTDGQPSASAIASMRSA